MKQSYDVRSDKMNKHHISLELNKVLSLLTEFTTCEDARYMAEHLEPETNLHLAAALFTKELQQ